MRNNANGKAPKSNAPRNSRKTNKRRSNSKGQSKGKYSEETADLESETNDPSWYAASPQLLKDAASINFTWPLGQQVQLNHPRFAQPRVVPGLQTMYLIPSVGYSSDPSSPINIAAQSFFSWVRHANSGSKNYDAPDLMIYTMAMTQVYSYINYLMRIYGTLNLYAQQNRYVPDGILEAQHLNKDSLYNNIAQFRYGINLLIDKAAQFAVPANMSIFARHAFLYRNVYVEGQSIKDQMYMYAPHGFWKFGLDDDGAGCLVLDDRMFVDQASKIDQAMLISYGIDMIDKILEQEGFGIMCGDILKAYGSGGILKLAYCPEVYVLTPLMDLAVLEQMKNTTVFPVSPDLYLSNTSIIQSPDKSHLLHTVSITRAKGNTVLRKEASLKFETLQELRILSTLMAEPTPELVIENTRLMAGLGPSTEIVIDKEGYTIAPIYCGSDICVACSECAYVYTATENGGFVRHMRPWNIAYAKIINTGMPGYDYVDDLSSSSVFKFRPYCHIITGNITETAMDVTDGGLFFDVDNYAILTHQELYRMHEMALMSMFAVPLVGSYR